MIERVGQVSLIARGRVGSGQVRGRAKSVAEENKKIIKSENKSGACGAHCSHGTARRAAAPVGARRTGGGRVLGRTRLSLGSAPQWG